MFSQDQSDLESDNQQQQNEESDYDEDDEDEDEDGSSGYAMPQRNTKWYTRMLVATNPQPPADEVANCMDSVGVAAEDAQNSQDMIQAEYQLSNSIEQNPKEYHWCFFQLMVNLDDRLGRGGALMTEIADDFFVGMRQLWILGRALDTHRGGEKYFQYVQKRYVQINKDLFGRTIVVMGRPMGNVHKMPKYQKSAGKAPVAGQPDPESLAVDTNKIRVNADNYQQGQDSNKSVNQEAEEEFAEENEPSPENEALNNATPTH